MTLEQIFKFIINIFIFYKYCNQKLFGLLFSYILIDFFSGGALSLLFFHNVFYDECYKFEAS
jgi:hypothetical protein